MAVIGLYDADMATYTHVPLNLDLMKLAAYHKKKKDIVSLTNKINFEKYTKILYRKDYYDGQFDSNILLNNKVEYGGRAFNQDIFIPMDLEIERCKPDTYIYTPMEKIFSTNNSNKQLFNQMMRARHLRLSLDGKTIWNEWESQINPNASKYGYMFHDYNIADIEGSWDVLNEINKSNESQKKILYGFKFPVQVYNAEDLFKWLEFNPMSKFYKVQMNGLLEDKDIIKLSEKIGNSNLGKYITYNITYGCKNQEEFIKERAMRVYLQLVYLRTHHQVVPLKYDDTIFSDKRWCRLLDLFQFFWNEILVFSKEEYERIVNFDSLYNFSSKLQDAETYKFHFKNLEKPLMLISEAREIFSMVREEYYDLFQAFYECHTIKIEGGNFTYDKHRN